MFQQVARRRLPIPDQQTATRITVSWCATQQHVPAVGGNPQTVRSIDRLYRLPPPTRILLRPTCFRRFHPRLRWIPFQQETTRITADKETILMGTDRIPLTEAGAVRPLVGARIILEETHREGGAAANRSIRCRRQTHQVCTFTAVVKAQLTTLTVDTIDDESLVHRVTFHQLFAVRKIAVEQRLARGDDRLGPALAVRADRLRLSFVQTQPRVPILCTRKRQTVDGAIFITIDIGGALSTSSLLQQGQRFT